MTRNEIIQNTTMELVKLHEADVFDESVVTLLLQSMALEIDNLAFMANFKSLDQAMRVIENR